MAVDTPASAEPTAPTGVVPTAQAIEPDVATLFAEAHNAVPSNDFYYRLFKQIRYVADLDPGPYLDSDSELVKLERSRRNAEIFLARALVSLAEETQPDIPDESLAPSARYLVDDFVVWDGVGEVEEFVKAAERWRNEEVACRLLFPRPPGLPPFLDPLAPARIACLTAARTAFLIETVHVADWFGDHGNDAKVVDKLLLESAEYVTNLSLLYLIVESPNLQRDVFVDEYRHMVDFLREIYDENNISIKSYSAITLYDLSRERPVSSWPTLQSAINRKFTPSGGYAEGTDYLGYTLNELLPLFQVSKMLGTSRVQVAAPERVLASGYWLLASADAAGVIPAVDDGLPSRVWLAPFAFLTGDEVFRQYVRDHHPVPLDLVPLRLFTYVFGGTFCSCEPQPAAEISNGIGKLRYRDGDGAMIDVTLLAESEQLLIEGGSHDQPDHLSLSINRIVDGRSEPLVLDPGYAGFAERGIEAEYSLHNSPLINPASPSPSSRFAPGGVHRNPTYTSRDIRNIFTTKFGDSLTRALIQLAAPVINAFLDDHEFLDTPKAAAGGSSAFEEPLERGLAARLYYDIRGNALRTAVDFRGHLVVADTIRSGEIPALHFNLPNGATATKDAQGVEQPNRWDAVSRDRGDASYTVAGGSRMRLSVFTEADHELMATANPDTEYGIRDETAGLRVTSIRFDTVSRPVGDETANFVTLIETADAGTDLRSLVESVDLGSGAVGIRSTSPDEIAYVAVPGDTGPVAIDAVAGTHGDFQATASLVLAAFGAGGSDLREIRLYGADALTYAGVPVDLGVGSGRYVTVSCAGQETLAIEADDDTILQHDPAFATACVSTPGSCEGREPTADEVKLFADVDFRGPCVIRGVGDYPNSRALVPLPNDSASSVKVGANVEAVLCEHDDFSGSCLLRGGDDANLHDDRLADRISSIRVTTKATPGSCEGREPTADEVKLFADVDFRGACVIRGVGDYPNSRALVPLPNDSASSVKVGVNVEVVLCEHDDFTGLCLLRGGDDSNLHNDRLADRISSIRVTPRFVPTGPTAACRSDLSGEFGISDPPKYHQFITREPDFEDALPEFNGPTTTKIFDGRQLEVDLEPHWAPGTYVIQGGSYDGYSGRRLHAQPSERWQIIGFLDENGEDVNPTGDPGTEALADGEEASWDGVMRSFSPGSGQPSGTAVTLTSPAATLVLAPLEIPGGSHGSVFPVCVSASPLTGSPRPPEVGPTDRFVQTELTAEIARACVDTRNEPGFRVDAVAYLSEPLFDNAPSVAPLQQGKVLPGTFLFVDLSESPWPPGTYRLYGASYEGYRSRDLDFQPSETWVAEFRSVDGEVLDASSATPDLHDYLNEASWEGSFRADLLNLPMQASQLVIRAERGVDVLNSVMPVCIAGEKLP